MTQQYKIIKEIQLQCIKHYKRIFLVNNGNIIHQSRIKMGTQLLCYYLKMVFILQKDGITIPVYKTINVKQWPFYYYIIRLCHLNNGNINQNCKTIKDKQLQWFFLTITTKDQNNGIMIHWYKIIKEIQSLCTKQEIIKYQINNGSIDVI